MLSGSVGRIGKGEKEVMKALNSWADMIVLWLNELGESILERVMPGIKILKKLQKI